MKKKKKKKKILTTAELTSNKDARTLDSIDEHSVSMKRASLVWKYADREENSDLQYVDSVMVKRKSRRTTDQHQH